MLSPAAGIAMTTPAQLQNTIFVDEDAARHALEQVR
jgi:hypothetical protein